MQNLPPGKTVFGLDQNLAALLCYLPFFFIHLIVSIAVIAQDKENRILRFHAFQSLFLTIASVVLQFVLLIVIMLFWVVGGIAGFAIDSATGVPVVSIIVMIIWFLLFILMIVVSLASLVFIIVAMIKAYRLEKWKIPFIGKFAEKYAG